jgi:CBS domain-containing protein
MVNQGTPPEPPTRGAADLRAVHLARRDIPALSPAVSLALAAHRMAAVGVRELPVAENGRVVGILAERDLQPHRGHWEWTTVRAAMTPEPATVDPDASAPAVARLLLARGFNSVPVVSGGLLVGMVGRVDLLRLIAEHL